MRVAILLYILILNEKYLLIFPKVVFKIEKFSFNAFCFKKCILSNLIFINHPVVINIRFSFNCASKSSLHKQVIERYSLSIIIIHKDFVICKGISGFIIFNPE